MCLFDLKCVNAIGLSPVGQKSGKRGKKSVYVCVCLCVSVTRFSIDVWTCVCEHFTEEEYVGLW